MSPPISALLDEWGIDHIHSGYLIVVVERVRILLTEVTQAK